MKKLMKFLDTLSRDEMRTITGGYGCGWSGGGSYAPDCDLSQGDAMALQAEFGGYWCCESCGTTYYCG